MKLKYIALMLCTVLAFGSITTGCKKQDETQQGVLDSRDVDFSNIGLKYTTPENWQEYTKSNNILPLAYEEDFTIANIRYNYISPTDWETISESKDGASVDEYLYPICEIIVTETEKASALKSSGLYTTFASRDLIKENNGVSYYLFSDYVGSTRGLSEEDVEIYDSICKTVNELAESFNVNDFDVDAYVEKKYADKNTLTFSSETLEGEAIDSSIFKDYDATLIFIWGTYIHPESDNLGDIQQAYEYAQELGNVNVISVCIDTPASKLDNSDETKALVQTAKDIVKDAGAEFDVIKIDEKLAGFIQEKFKTIPAFTFVDKDGIVRGGYFEGLYTGDNYEEYIDIVLRDYIKTAE